MVTRLADLHLVSSKARIQKDLTQPIQGEPGPPGRSVAPASKVPSAGRYKVRYFRQGLDIIFHILGKMTRCFLTLFTSTYFLMFVTSKYLYCSFMMPKKPCALNPEYTALVSHALGISAMTRDKSTMYMWCDRS